MRFEFKSSNNEAEYEALIAGLSMALKMGAKKVKAHVDSLMVANQINGEYEAKGEFMVQYLEYVKGLIQKFDSCEIVHISRGQNRKADALSKLSSVSFQHLAKEIRVEVLQHPTVPIKEVHDITIEERTWMTPVVEYLQKGILPADKAEARKIRVNSLKYQFVTPPLGAETRRCDRSYITTH
jgi:hypothetical protein